MHPKAHFTDDERRRMENYHARPPAEGGTHPRTTSTVLSSASSASSSSAAQRSTENAHPCSRSAEATEARWISLEEVSARAAALGATSSSHSSSSLLLHNPLLEVSPCVGRHSSRSRQAPGYLADYVSTPPQENRKKRRLISAPHRRQPLPQPQPDVGDASAAQRQQALHLPKPAVASGWLAEHLPRFHCPFTHCGRASAAFAGWQRSEQLLQHINSIHASREDYPSEAFLQDRIVVGLFARTASLFPPHEQAVTRTRHRHSQRRHPSY